MKFNKGDKVECVDNSAANGGLTKGKEYVVGKDQEYDFVHIANDNGAYKLYLAERFTSVASPLSKAKRFLAAAEALEVAQKQYEEALAALN